MQKITEQQLELNQQLQSNTDDYCGLDIHKLKTSFFGSICGRWLSTKKGLAPVSLLSFFGPWASCLLCEVAELIQMKSCPFVLPFMFVFKQQTSHVCPSVVPKDLRYRFSSGQSPDACLNKYSRLLRPVFLRLRWLWISWGAGPERGRALVEGWGKIVIPGPPIGCPPQAPGPHPTQDCDWLWSPMTLDSPRCPCLVAPPWRELEACVSEKIIHNLGGGLVKYGKDYINAAFI